MKLTFVISVVFFLMASMIAYAQTPKFVGANKCKICHKKAKDGNAFGIWQKSKHAKAFPLLAGADAKMKAKKLGVVDPQKSLACLICHTSGAHLPASNFAAGFKKEDGVQCENCHGAGSLYRKKKIMQQLRKERLAGGNKLAKKYGFLHAGEKTCVEGCHQPERTVDGKTYVNPSYKPFNFKERYAKIAHPVPKQ